MSEPGAATTMHGSFSWVGLRTTAADSVKRFYGTLFGWESDEGVTEGARPYSIMRGGGEDVALLYEISAWQRALDTAPSWATFVTVSDVEATAARAAELGGGVVIRPFDAGNAGRIAVIADPAWARLSLWQPGGHPGPPRGGGIGTCCWNELATPDFAGSARFYASLLGWGIVRDGRGHGFINNRGRVQGGVEPLANRKAPARWLAYFEVANVEETVERCESAGGGVRTASYELDAGPFAVLADPEGAAFGVCEAHFLCDSGRAAGLDAAARARDPSA